MSFSFNGSTDYLQVPVPTDGFPITLSCFARRPSGGANQALLTLGTSGDSNRFQMVRDGASRLFAASQIFSAGTQTGAVSFPDSQWVWCAATLQSDFRRDVYVDNNTAFNNNQRVLGTTLDEILVAARRQAGTAGAFFNGILTNVGVWRRVLTADELKALRAGFAPSRVSMNGLLYETRLIREIDNPLGKSVTTFGSPTFSALTPRLYP